MVMLIDGLSEFIRHFTANPTQSAITGNHIGGAFGFLRALSYLTYNIRPSKIIIAWDGKDSSKNRRKLLPEYKNGRTPLRLNRFYKDETPVEVEENKKYQLRLLFLCLKCLPITQVFSDGCEADDIIAYLCANKFKDNKKLIVTNDKDFFQLLDNKTIIYRSIKREYVTKKHLIEEFKILPENFAIAKAINGDKSDNVTGVHGFGFKTIAKMFPILSEKYIYINDFIETVEGFEEKNKLIERFLEDKEVVKNNYRVVALDGVILKNSQIDQLEYCFEKEVVYDKIKLLRLFNEYGFNKFGFNWPNVFNYLMEVKNGV